MKTGLSLILAERLRQITVEGYSLQVDSKYTRRELKNAADCYLQSANATLRKQPLTSIPVQWPWDKKWWKPSNDPVRDLVRAGALYRAERDRLIHETHVGEAAKMSYMVELVAGLIDQIEHLNGAEFFTRTWIAGTYANPPLDRPILAIGQVIYDDGTLTSVVPFEATIEFKDGEWLYAERDEYGGQLSVRGDHRSKIVFHWWIDLPFNTTQLTSTLPS